MLENISSRRIVINLGSKDLPIKKKTRTLKFVQSCIGDDKNEYFLKLNVFKILY
jgi:hypothetical protein